MSEIHMLREGSAIDAQHSEPRLRLVPPRQASVDARCPRGRTAVMYATASGSAPMVKMLVEAAGSILSQDRRAMQRRGLALVIRQTRLGGRASWKEACGARRFYRVPLEILARSLAAHR